MHPALWMASGLAAIWLLWFAGARRAICPPVALIFSVVVGVFLFAYVSTSSGAYVQNEIAASPKEPTPVATPLAKPIAQKITPKKKHVSVQRKNEKATSR